MLSSPDLFVLLFVFAVCVLCVYCVYTVCILRPVFYSFYCTNNSTALASASLSLQNYVIIYITLNSKDIYLYVSTKASSSQGHVKITHIQHIVLLCVGVDLHQLHCESHQVYHEVFSLETFFCCACSPCVLSVVQPPPTGQRHAVGLTGDSKLPIAVNVRVNGCLSLYTFSTGREKRHLS